MCEEGWGGRCGGSVGGKGEGDERCVHLWVEQNEDDRFFAMTKFGNRMLMMMCLLDRRASSCVSLFCRDAFSMAFSCIPLAGSAFASFPTPTSIHNHNVLQAAHFRRTSPLPVTGVPSSRALQQEQAIPPRDGDGAPLAAKADWIQMRAAKWAWPHPRGNSSMIMMHRAWPQSRSVESDRAAVVIGISVYTQAPLASPCPWQ